jgi:hypothetical protein
MIYEELVTLNAESSFAHVGLGKVKFFEEELTKAKEFLTAGIVSLHDSSSIFHIKNKQELVLNNLLFFSGLQLLPSSSLGWYFMSQSQLLYHQYEDAVSSCTKGLSFLHLLNILFIHVLKLPSGQG